jgi:hypothetical protein
VPGQGGQAFDTTRHWKLMDPTPPVGFRHAGKVRIGIICTKDKVRVLPSRSETLISLITQAASMASAKEQENAKSNAAGGAPGGKSVKSEPMEDDVEVLEGNLKNIVEHGVSSVPSSPSVPVHASPVCGGVTVGVSRRS